MVTANLKAALLNVQKPGRYIGGEPGSVLKNADEVDLRFAFCFPDTYEIGMSYLGMKILYEILNNQQNIWCERAFMPWVDMYAQMKERNIKLFSNESKTSLREFDILGFTLQYELSFSNIVAMLNLSGIPYYSKDRDLSYPLIIGGGPNACNPEPIADFFDAILLGEGEYATLEICNAVIAAKKEGVSKKELLKRLSKIDGVYIPSFYDVQYKNNGEILAINALEGAPARVSKTIVRNFNTLPAAQNFIVPLIGAVHDRAMVEVLRGCVRGCRFCQAGFIYRPMRERDIDLINTAAKCLCEQTGYEEVSLTSLATNDHSGLEPLLDKMLEWTADEKVNIALPSLRIDNFSEQLINKVATVRKSGLTFAPEGGTQRMRDIINKNITEDEILKSCRIAFSAGYKTVKLYFMLGLPFETEQDIKGIAETSRRIIDLYYAEYAKQFGKGVQINISVATFVPKPFTPFEFVPQDTREQQRAKQQLLLTEIAGMRSVRISYSDADTSIMEAVFSRGDRRLAGVIVDAFENGCMFDGWGEHFKYAVWAAAIERAGLDIEFYANRLRSFDETAPWAHLDFGIEKAFLVKEYEKAQAAAVTQPCNRACAHCGADRLNGGACFVYNKGNV